MQKIIIQNLANRGCEFTFTQSFLLRTVVMYVCVVVVGWYKADSFSGVDLALPIV